MKHYYCTAASAEYVHKVVALYDSISSFDSGFCIYILCLEAAAYEMLKALELDNAVLIRLEELEAEDVELASAKPGRTLREYAWTAKASIILYVFKHWTQIPAIIWVDSDTMFLAEPACIFREFEKASILLTPERFSGSHSYLADRYGKYQMGFMGFRRDLRAEACLMWFREKLIDWCYDRFEDGRWADQKHADDWTERFEGVCVLDAPGINMTPFVLYTLLTEGRQKLREREGAIYAGSERIVLFHYYGFRYFNSNEMDLCFYNMDFNDEAIRLLYIPYNKKLKASVDTIMARTSVRVVDGDIDKSYIGNYFNYSINNKKLKNICSILYEQLSITQYENLRRLLCRYPVRLWFCCIGENVRQSMTALGSDNIILLSNENLEDGCMKELLKLGGAFEHDKAMAVSLLLYILKNNYGIDCCIYSRIETLWSINPEEVFAQRDGGYLYCINSDKELKLLSRDILEAETVGVVRNEYSLTYLKLLRKKYLAEALPSPRSEGLEEAEQYSQWLEMFNGIRKIQISECSKSAMEGGTHETQLLLNLQ